MITPPYFYLITYVFKTTMAHSNMMFNIENYNLITSTLLLSTKGLPPLFHIFSQRCELQNQKACSLVTPSLLNYEKHLKLGLS